MSASLARIEIYPLKSGDGQSVALAAVLPSGALQHDRRFAMVDEAGKFINATRMPLFHKLRTHFDPASDSLSFAADGRREVFSLVSDGGAIEAWLSSYFGLSVRLIENQEVGLPDDPDAPGPTVVSTATLVVVASWFDGLSVEEVRRRFRANLEIDGVEPFWEDRLCAAVGQVVRFRVGDVMLGGVNPCQRCVVPSRDSQTGEVWPEFSRRFSRQRQQHLPEWADRSRFDHFYRLSVNTQAVGSPGVVCVGDEVEITE